MNERVVEVYTDELQIAKNDASEKKPFSQNSSVKKLNWHLLAVILSFIYSVSIGLLLFNYGGYVYSLDTTLKLVILPLIPVYLIGYLIFADIKRRLLTKIIIVYWQVYYIVTVWWVSKASVIWPHPPVQSVLFRDTIFFIIFLQIPYIIYLSILFYHRDMKRYLSYLLVVTIVSVLLGWVISYGWWLNWY